MSYTFDDSGRPQKVVSTQSNKNENQAEMKVFPTEAIPIIFLPGILASPLRVMGNMPLNGRYKPKWAWFPDFSAKWVAGLFTWKKGYADLSPAERKILLNPTTTQALGRFDQDIEPDLIGRMQASVLGDFSYSQFDLTSARLLSVQETLRRGWGTVMWETYGMLLSSMEKNLRYLTYSADPYSKEIEALGDKVRLAHPIRNAMDELLKGENGKFRPALKKSFPDVDPENAKAESYIEALKPLLSEGRKYHYPVFAVGYNWLQSNNDSAKYVYEQIKEIKKYVEKRPSGIKDTNKKEPPKPGSGGLGWGCNDGVILVTHSMGGLVGRALANNHPDLQIRGVLHNAQPCNGSATLYARMKGGWEGIAGTFLAEIGDELMPVLTQSPGATELSPNQNYGANWLRIYDRARKYFVASYPKDRGGGKSDPYEDIYLQKNVWWKLGDVNLMDPDLKKDADAKITWNNYEKIVKNAQKFHEQLDEYYHPNTYMLYGNSPKYKTWGTVTWEIGYYRKTVHMRPHSDEDESYTLLGDVVPLDVATQTQATTTPVRRGKLGQAQMRLNGNTQPGSHIELKAFMRAGETHGDGTVPFNSANPWQAKGTEVGATNAVAMSGSVPRHIQYTFEFKDKAFEHSKSCNPVNTFRISYYSLLNIIGKK